VTESPRLAAASAKALPSKPVPRNAMLAMVVVLKRVESGVIDEFQRK
jgi:hypothetical protein